MAPEAGEDSKPMRPSRSGALKTDQSTSEMRQLDPQPVTRTRGWARQLLWRARMDESLLPRTDRILSARAPDLPWRWYRGGSPPGEERARFNALDSQGRREELNDE
jgi:hypothetical protein